MPDTAPTSPPADPAAQNAAPAGRRRHARRATRCAARLALGGGHSLDVRIIDISEGGLGLVSQRPLPLGSHFVLRWALPDADGEPQAVQATACVTHSVLSGALAGFRVGVRFVQVDGPVSRLIRQYVHRSPVVFAEHADATPVRV